MDDVSLMMAAFFAVAAFYEQYARNRAYRWLDRAREDGQNLLATLRARKALGGTVDSAARLTSTFMAPLSIALSRYSSRFLLLVNIGLFTLKRLGTKYTFNADFTRWNLPFLAALCFLLAHLGMASLIERGNWEFERERRRSFQDLGDEILLDISSSFFSVRGGPDPRAMERFDPRREVGGAPRDVLYASRPEFAEAELARGIVSRLRDSMALSPVGEDDAVAIEQACDLLDAIQHHWKNSIPPDWKRLVETIERRQERSSSASLLEASDRGIGALGDLCDARTAELIFLWLTSPMALRKFDVEQRVAEQLRDFVAPRALKNCADSVSAYMPDVPEWLFPKSFVTWQKAISSSGAERTQSGMKALIARAFNGSSPESAKTLAAVAVDIIYRSSTGMDWVGLLSTMLLQRGELEDFVSVQKTNLYQPIPPNCWYDPAALIDLGLALAVERRSGTDDAQSTLEGSCSTWRMPYVTMAMVESVASYRFDFFLDLAELIKQFHPPTNEDRTVDLLLDFVEANAVDYASLTRSWDHRQTPFLGPGPGFDYQRALSSSWGVSSGLELLEQAWPHGPEERYRAQFINLVSLIEAVVALESNLEVIERICGVGPHAEARVQ